MCWLFMGGEGAGCGGCLEVLEVKSVRLLNKEHVVVIR